MNPKRKQSESIIYDTMDALDPSGKNSAFYKTIFARMDDKQFVKFASGDFPYKFQTRLFEIEPTFSDIEKAANVVGVPLLEKVNLPYLFTNKNGDPVTSQECLVVYIHLKKMKQFITKKNSMSTDISQRDMKTGLLVSHDKNGQTSDREMEALSVMGLDKTMDELSRYRADSMQAKSLMNSTINTTGMVNMKDIPVDIDDSLSKNLLNVYFIGAMLNSNLVNQDYLLPGTIRDRQRKVERET